MKYDAIIIGSGIGGLTTGSLLAQLFNKRVLILEQHFKVGGFTHTFSRPGGYQWDVGLHYVGDLREGSLFRGLINLVTDCGVKWQKMPNQFERFVYPDFSFDVSSHPHQYQKDLIALFPKEETNIKGYFRDIENIYKYYIINSIKNNFPLMSIFKTLLIKYAKSTSQTTKEYLNEKIQDKKLRALLATQWIDYGLPPSYSSIALHALTTRHYFYGGYYPIGTSESIGKSIEKILKSHGGEIKVNHRAVEIITKDGVAIGVRVQKGNKEDTGEEFYAPIVISNIGAINTYTKLLPTSKNFSFYPEIEEERVSILNPTIITLFLGLNQSPRKIGFNGENHWLNDNYDHDQNWAEKDELINGKCSCCLLTFPSLKDPQAENHTMEILVPISYQIFHRWREEQWKRRGQDYEQLKEQIVDSILKFIGKFYPQLLEIISYKELATPLTVENFTAHVGGAIYGIPGTVKRYNYQWLKAKTEIKNLYLSGSDVFSHGIVGALIGGAICAVSVMGGISSFTLFNRARRLSTYC